MYVFEAGKSARRVMHLQRFTATGVGLAASLCNAPHNFNRAINVPLAKPICKRCLRIAAETR